MNWNWFNSFFFYILYYLKKNNRWLGHSYVSFVYGTLTLKAEAFEHIRKAYKFGYNFFDTAECNIRKKNSDGSFSYNEEHVGESVNSFFFGYFCWSCFSFKRIICTSIFGYLNHDNRVVHKIIIKY